MARRRPLMAEKEEELRIKYLYKDLTFKELLIFALILGGFLAAFILSLALFVDAYKVKEFNSIFALKTGNEPVSVREIKSTEQIKHYQRQVDRVITLWVLVNKDSYELQRCRELAQYFGFHVKSADEYLQDPEFWRFIDQKRQEIESGK